MENLSKKFLQYPSSIRRNILIEMLKKMNDKAFDELCFRLTASEEVLAVWDQKMEPTNDMLDIIARMFFIMRSGALTKEFAEKFGDV